MKLSEKKAIEIAIELWIWLAETGDKAKGNWPGWDRYEYMTCNCPLCEYSSRQNPDAEDYCVFCPYYKAFGACTNDVSPYDKWEVFETKRTKKKYASLFLEQLRQL